MKLQEWITLTGIKKSHLARLLGISNAAMTRILKHGQLPQPEEMVKIYWISFGAVRPDDFYDIASVPAELRYLLEPNPRRNTYVSLNDIATLGKSKRDSWKRSAVDN